MRIKSRLMYSLVMVPAVLFLGAMLIHPESALAQQKVGAAEGVSYNANAPMVDNLKLFAGKRIEVVLGSGKTFTGVVKEVGAHLLHLEKLEGKEYFDALIRIEEISAIDTRFRGEQRP